MKAIVVSFKVIPIVVLVDETTGLVDSENVAPAFMMYPNKPFDIGKTIKDIELLFEGNDGSTDTENPV